MYDATDLLLFLVYILPEMIIGKYVLRIIVSNIIQIVVVNVHHPLPRNLKQHERSIAESVRYFRRSVGADPQREQSHAIYEEDIIQKY